MKPQGGGKGKTKGQPSRTKKDQVIRGKVGGTNKKCGKGVKKEKGSSPVNLLKTIQLENQGGEENK